MAKQGRPIGYGEHPELEEFVDTELVHMVEADIRIDYCDSGFKVYRYGQLLDIWQLKALFERFSFEGRI